MPGPLRRSKRSISSRSSVTPSRASTDSVYVDPAIRRYITTLVRATRNVTELLGPELGNYVEIGASPRGSIAFFQAARAMAVVQGRHYVIPEDVRELRHSVLRHRIHLSFEALADRAARRTSSAGSPRRTWRRPPRCPMCPPGWRG